MAGIALYISGGILKGFATTLIIGIVSSLFTGVLVGRLIMHAYISFLGNKKLSFGLASKGFLQNTHIDFFGIRKIAYLFSVAFIGLGGMFIYKQGGLNLGVDFTGGRTYVVEFTEYVHPIEMREKLAKVFNSQSTDVITYGKDNVLRVTTSYLAHINSIKTDKKIQMLLIENIAAHTGLKYVENTKKLANKEFTITSSSKVGPTLAESVRKSAHMAIFLSLLMIFLYILWRFKRWEFGLSAIIALLHDILVVIAAFGIAKELGFNYEIDGVFVGSISTVSGYSITDTVVVLTFIKRRLQRVIGKPNLQEVINTAINKTLSRTLITSLTTFITVFCLFIFGGTALKGLAFPVLVGILFGTYSSIFIAGPLSVDIRRLVQK